MENRIIHLDPTDLTETLTLKQLHCVYSYYYTPQFAFSGESHEPWEIVYVQSGRVIVETSDYKKTLNEGTAILHKPWEFHKIKADNTSCYVYIISFTVEQNDLLFPAADTPMQIDDTEKLYLLNIISEGTTVVAGKNHIPILPKFKKQNFATSQTVKNLLELLLIRFIRKNDSESSNHGSIITENALILSVISLLNENLCSGINLEYIADKVGYSVSRISAIFKNYTGESIINYFIKMRIQKAQELIVANQMSLKNISDYLNFDTVQYFSTQFKKITGLTPIQYKNIVKISSTYCDLNYNKI